MKTLRNRGYATVLAMLLLVLGLTFSGWLFAVLSNNIAVTRNETSAGRAGAAADSGLEFLRHELGIITGQTTFKGLNSEDAIFTKIADAIIARSSSGQIGTTATKGEDGIGFTLADLTLASGDSFTCEVTPSKREAFGYTIAATGKAAGTNPPVTRTVCMEISAKIAFGTSSMDYPIVSRDPMRFQGSSAIMRYDSETGVTDEVGQVLTLDGEEDDLHLLHFPGYSPMPDGEVVMPEKYLPDPFYQTLKSMTTSGQLTTVSADVKGATLTNVRVETSSTAFNKPRVFEDCTINGILYVEWPNSIEFKGNVQLNGVVIYGKPAVEGDATKNNLICLARGLTIENNLEAALPFLKSAFEEAAPTISDSLLSDISGWAIFAPDCDFSFTPGAQDGLRTLNGNFHINTLGMAAGEGAPEPGDLVIHGQILCEGGVDLRGNQVFCIEPPKEGDNIEFERRAKLTIAPGAYWEAY